MSRINSEAKAELVETITSNPFRTRRRLADLEAYFRRSVLDRRRRFICQWAEKCMKSHAGAQPQGRFYEAQLHHVGNHYDLGVDGRAMRVVVVGQENGGPPKHITMEDRWAQVVGISGQRRRFKPDRLHKSRNPHMRGTTSLLRLIFGQGPGSDYDSEVLGISGQKVHLFDCFALVNYLLCSAVEPDSVHSQATTEMRRNCANHFQTALEILEPSIIVIQGRNVRRWLGENGLFGLSAKPVGTVEDPVLEYPLINGRTPTLVTFSHPSYPGPAFGWASADSPYLLKTVVPLVRSLRPE